jgi:phage terminase large subunit
LTTIDVVAGYTPTPQQNAFRNSPAKIRGYGGAMGGGKSRAICEEAFDLALDFPGLTTLICRQAHTSIIETTKKTMMDEVLPPQLLGQCRKKESGGEDYLRLPNGSTFHFIGLEDPVRWFSSEIGLIIIDQVEECSEDTVVKLITRLRQRDMPRRVILSFNPENPGHWLQRWFILGATQTRYGFRKTKLFATGASKPIGDAEFIFAKPTDNPHLPAGYVEDTLGGMPDYLRRRYLEGEWLYTSGTCFFDLDALGEYQKRVGMPKWTGHTQGAAGRHEETRDDPCKFKLGNGPWAVWESPVREEYNSAGQLQPAHRYVVTVDVSSGGAQDYSAVQVIDVEEFSQVAEFQGMTDPDLLAIEAYRVGRIYNNALVAPEVTGGWGFTIVRELERLRYPRIYTRRIEDRVAKKWTDKTGWDTTTKTRAFMLDTLERVLREKEFGLRSERSLTELLTFVRDDNGKPEAQPGANDDLVISLAMGVAIATQLPRQLQRRVEPEYQPRFAATGY